MKSIIRTSSIAIFVVGAAAFASRSADAAISSTNTSNDSTAETYAFQYSTAGSFYRAYIDADVNASTGYSVGGVGADYLLENGSLYHYTGPGWAWTLVRAVAYSNIANTVVWTFSRSDVGETNCTSESSNVVFQVEASGLPKDTSGILQHTFIPCSSQLFDDRTTNDAGNVYYRFQYSGSWTLFHVFIDTDANAGTGYATNGIGADYFVEGGTLYQHTGGSTSWTWNNLGAVTFSSAGNVATWTVPRASIGETGANETADVVYQIQSGGTTAALPKHHHVYWAGTTAGSIVPLYSYPTNAAWPSIVTDAKNHPAVPVIAVVNVSSGPGSSPADPSFTNGINNLKSASNITVLGYVDTNYAARAQSTVQADINTWKSLYPKVDGIFFDEMYNKTGQEPYYSSLDSYARTQGFTYTVGNPGADTIPSYVGTVNTILVYEGPGLPTTWDSWYSSYALSNFGVIPYEVPSLDANWVATAKQHVGWIYSTNDGSDGNRWDSLSSYFDSLLGLL